MEFFECQMTLKDVCSFSVWRYLLVIRWCLECYDQFGLMWKYDKTVIIKYQR